MTDIRKHIFRAARLISFIEEAKRQTDMYSAEHIWEHYGIDRTDSILNNIENVIIKNEFAGYRRQYDVQGDHERSYKYNMRQILLEAFLPNEHGNDWDAAVARSTRQPRLYVLENILNNLDGDVNLKSLEDDQRDEWLFGIIQHIGIRVQVFGTPFPISDSDKVQVDTGTGLCANIRYSPTLMNYCLSHDVWFDRAGDQLLERFEEIVRGWEEFSGYINYPVPSYNEHVNDPEMEYELTSNKYNNRTEYGKARRRLIRYVWIQTKQKVQPRVDHNFHIKTGTQLEKAKKLELIKAIDKVTLYAKMAGRNQCSDDWMAARNFTPTDQVYTAIIKQLGPQSPAKQREYSQMLNKAIVDCNTYACAENKWWTSKSEYDSESHEGQVQITTLIKMTDVANYMRSQCGDKRVAFVSYHYGIVLRAALKSIKKAINNGFVFEGTDYPFPKDICIDELLECNHIIIDWILENKFDPIKVMHQMRSKYAEYVAEWEPSKGNIVYPVPHPVLDRSVAAETITNMWEGEYGCNRIALLDYVINALEQEANNK